MRAGAAMALLLLPGCLPGALGLGPTEGVPPKQEAPMKEAAPVDPASLSCDALMDKPGGCQPGRDCEGQCVAGEARSCELMGRELMMGKAAVPLWRSICRNAGGSRPWCASDDTAAAARAFLARGCNLGNGPSCFGLVTMTLAGPPSVRGSIPLGPATGRASALFNKACECGNEGGCKALIEMHVLGAKLALEDDPPNEEMAARMLSEACHRGDNVSCKRGVMVLAKLSERDGQPRPNDLLATACDRGDKESCLVVEVTAKAKDKLPGAEDTPDGMQRKLREAEALCSDTKTCESECKGSNTYACIVLGGKYWDGTTAGIARNPSKGTALYQEACDRDNKFACKMLETLYKQASECELGEDCDMGCSGDLWPACVRIADALIQGRGQAKNPSRAFTLLKKGCDAGHGLSCNNLAYLYGKGIGTAKDMRAADRAFQKGCEAGLDMACRGLENTRCITTAITPAQRRPAKDAICEKGRKSPAMAVDRTRRYLAYEHPDQNKLDLCFDAIRSQGCFQINLRQEDTSIYCCP